MQRDISTAAESMPIEYFAYASNMDPAVVAEKSSGHKTLGPASLEGYRLAFMRRSIRSGTGVADIVPTRGSEVWGVLYEVAENGLDLLDRKEGLGWAYKRIEVPVRLQADGSTHHAQTYVVVSKEPSEVPPSADYLERLVSAAEEQGLPETYIAELRKVGEAVAERSG